MARTKKKPAKKKAKAKKKAQKTKRTPAKAKPAAKRRSAKSGKRGSAKSDVERRWQSYWSCRKDLETAIAAVQEADKALQSARDLERKCRQAFDETKDTLKKLLEVAPASAGGDGGASSLFDADPAGGPSGSGFPSD